MPSWTAAFRGVRSEEEEEEEEEVSDKRQPAEKLAEYKEGTRRRDTRPLEVKVGEVRASAVVRR